MPLRWALPHPSTKQRHHSDASPSLKCGPMSHSLTILNLVVPSLDVGHSLRCRKNWALWGKQLGGDLLLACPFDLCLPVPVPLVFCWVYRLLEKCFPIADRCLLIYLISSRSRILVLHWLRGCPAFGQAVLMGSISFSEEDTVELICSLMEASWELILASMKFPNFKYPVPLRKPLEVCCVKKNSKPLWTISENLSLILYFVS